MTTSARHQPTHAGNHTVRCYWDLHQCRWRCPTDDDGPGRRPPPRTLIVVAAGGGARQQDRHPAARVGAGHPGHGYRADDGC